MLPQERFLTIRMDVINRCNLLCEMCYFSLEWKKKVPKREMSPELFRKIADSMFPIAKRLILTVGYEPLMSKSFPDMLNVTSRYHIPHVSFITNGTLLNRKNIEQIIHAGVNEVIVSLDSANPKTYETIRRGSKFKKVASNLELLQQMKSEFNRSNPEINLGVVLMRKNMEELPGVLHFANKLGIRRVSATHLIPYSGLNLQKESLNLHKELANRCLDEARNLARELEIEFSAPFNFKVTQTRIAAGEKTESDDEIPCDQPGDLEGKEEPIIETEELKKGYDPPESGMREKRESPQPALDDSSQSGTNDCAAEKIRCHWPFEEIIISPDGKVTPCCYWYEAINMGDFNLQDFTEIWNSKEYATLRDQLKSGDLRATCRSCPMNKDSGDIDEDLFSERKMDYFPDVLVELKVVKAADPAKKIVVIGRLHNHTLEDRKVGIALTLKNGSGDMIRTFLDIELTIARQSEYIDSVLVPVDGLDPGVYCVHARVSERDSQATISQASCEFTLDRG